MMYKSDRRVLLLSNIVMILLCVITLFPLLLILSASFTDEQTALTQGFSLIPIKFATDAYEYIMQHVDLVGRAYLVTIEVTVIGTALNLVISMMYGYGLTCDIPMKKFFMVYVVITMLFNGGLVATYFVYVNYIHVKNTLWGLILPGGLTNAFTIILVRNYIQNSIPRSLVESATLDGAGHMRVFTSIVLPLSKPILATIGLQAAIGFWNNWTNSMYYIDNDRLLSIQALLNKINESATFLASSGNLSQMGVTNTERIPTTTVRMAIAMVGMIPLICVYPFFQQYFVKGITLGAVKE